jgi:hypothetical protein
VEYVRLSGSIGLSLSCVDLDPELAAERLPPVSVSLNQT